MKPNKLGYKFLFLMTFLTTISYIIWRIFYTIPLGEGKIALVIGIGLLLVEFIGMLEAFEHYYNMSYILTPQKQAPPASWYPDIDVFIATYNEPAELLQKTINGCIKMDYPDKTKVHIYICDDNRRPEIEALAQKMGVNYIKRKDNKDAKAGNYNHALNVTSSPIIVTLDADMIPMRHFLMTLIPYFYEETAIREARTRGEKIPEKKIGFIQAPQNFYNPDLFQFNLYSEAKIPDEQDYFYRDVQISRNKSNAVIYGGSNTAISRKALNEVGGFFTGVITEDFATGIMIQKKGYTCYAIDKIIASGLSPSDLKSLINQRKRWARGCIQTMKATGFLYKRGWSFAQRLCYLSSVIYWYSPLKRLFYLISPIAFSVFSIIVVKCSVQQVLLFWLPMYFFQYWTLKVLSSNIRNTRWTNVYETILFSSLLPAVILETFGIKNRKFSVTRKDGQIDNLKTYRIWHSIPYFILAFLCVLGILNCIRSMFATGYAAYIVILFWLLNNLYMLIMTLFFINGRTIKRKSERYKAELPCKIIFDDKCIRATTVDISENGFAFVLNFPEYIPDTRDIKGILENDRHTASFSCRISKVTHTDDTYIYAVYIIKCDDFENQLSLYSIIYDRLPSLPRKIAVSNSLFDDLVINAKKRKHQKEYINRRLPRIYLNKSLSTLEGPTVKLVDFNFAYTKINSSVDLCIYKHLTLKLPEDIFINCRLVKSFSSLSNTSCLYAIDNMDELVNNNNFLDILQSWQNIAIRKKAAKKVNTKENRGVVANEFYERNYF